MAPNRNKCPQCSAALPAGVLAGLCPACLLKQGAAADTAPGPAAVPFEPPALADLARHFPQLEILELIGRGGMGAVYKARQKQLDRLVALKILPPDVGHAPAFAERFTREAKALARLNHPNIVTLYEFGQTAGDGETSAAGLFYFLMEFVDGVNLRQLLNASRLAPREALAIVPQICDALQYAHDQGIVHRDIKPENILLDRQGRVKVADFGLAKLVGRGTEESFANGSVLFGASTTTEAGAVMGTPQYMAPEQREHPQEVDHRADIFSLGVVFYQMLTGELPAGRFEPPSKKVVIDVRLDEVVLRALEKNPERRYQQASQVKTMVETIALTPPSMASAPVPPFAARFSRTAIVGACWAPLFVLMAVFWFVATVYVAGPAETPPPGPRWWQIILAVTLLPLGLTAPFGTTMLGWIAVSQIRRSAGKLYGMWLAMFDGLLFPLLVLDALIISAWVLVARLVAHLVWRLDGSLFLNLADMIVWIVLMIASVSLVDFLIIRAVWRAVNKPRDSTPSATGSASGPAAPPLVGTPTSQPRPKASVTMVVLTLAVHGVMLAVLLALAVFVVPRFIAVFQNMGVALPTATALVITLDRFLVTYWFLVFPAVLALDAAFCILLRQVGGRRALLGWAVGVVGALGLAAAGLALALFLPMQTLTQSLNPRKASSGPATPTRRGEFPEGAHISANNRSVFVSHDRVDASYVLYYEGDFNSTSHGSHNTRSMKWVKDSSLRLKNGRNFGCIRESVSPESLRLNGQEFDLRRGRVFVLHDDGTAEHLPLFPSLAVARDTKALTDLIALYRERPAAWSPSLGPTGKPDLDRIRNEAKELTAQGHYEEALQRCLWYHQHALEYDPGLSAVRLSFALADWVELARRYPKAKAALLEVRDNGARQFAQGRGNFDLFMDVSRINSGLQQDDATVALFKTVLQQDPALARQCYFAAGEVLFQRGEYELCLNGMGGSQTEFARISAAWEWEKKSGPRKTAEDNFVRQNCRLIDILVGLGRTTEAEGIVTMAVAVLDDPRLKSAVRDAAGKAVKKHDRAVHTIR